ncbi:MAG: tRNA (adenosine(37)-N6)-threonylcarbamoyltransferase complex ATPase subunit type 1 TsaE [Burkholderiales bacterium]
MHLHLPDETATRALGAALASAITPGIVIFLSGDLGAGKTTLVRGLIRGLGYAGKVKSPTFSLVEPYVFSRLDLYHFDLYRLKSVAEWDDSGFREYFGGDAVCLVEWPEQALEVLPHEDLQIRFVVRDSGRDATIEATTELGDRCRQQLLNILPSNIARIP